MQFTVRIKPILPPKYHPLSIIRRLYLLSHLPLQFYRPVRLIPFESVGALLQTTAKRANKRMVREPAKRTAGKLCKLTPTIIIAFIMVVGY